MKLLPRHMHEHDAFDDYVAAVQAYISTLPRNTAVFTAKSAESPKLSEIYLKAIPKAHRQHHNCHACLEWMDHYGWAYVMESGVPSALFFKAVSSDKVIGKALEKVSAAVLQVAENDCPVRVVLGNPDGTALGPLTGLPQTGHFTHFFYKNLPQVSKEAPHVVNARIERMASLLEDGAVSVKSVQRLLDRLRSIPNTAQLLPQLEAVLTYLQVSDNSKACLAAAMGEGVTHFRASLAYKCLSVKPQDLPHFLSSELNGLKYQRGSSISAGLVVKAETALSHMREAMVRTWLCPNYFEERANVRWAMPLKQAAREPMFKHIVAPSAAVQRRVQNLGTMNKDRFLQLFDSLDRSEGVKRVVVNVNAVVVHQFTAPQVAGAVPWTFEQGDIGRYALSNPAGQSLRRNLVNQPVSYLWLDNYGHLNFLFGEAGHGVPKHWGVFKQDLRPELREFAALLEKHSTTPQALGLGFFGERGAVRLSGVWASSEPLYITLESGRTTTAVTVLDL